MSLKFTHNEWKTGKLTWLTTFICYWESNDVLHNKREGIPCALLKHSKQHSTLSKIDPGDPGWRRWLRFRDFTKIAVMVVMVRILHHSEGHICDFHSVGKEHFRSLLHFFLAASVDQYSISM